MGFYVETRNGIHYVNLFIFASSTSVQGIKVEPIVTSIFTVCY